MPRMRRAAPSAMSQPGVSPAFRADSSRARKRPVTGIGGPPPRLQFGVTVHDGARWVSRLCCWQTARRRADAWRPSCVSATGLTTGSSPPDRLRRRLRPWVSSATARASRVAVTGGAGQNRLESLTLTDLESSTAETVGAGALFVLIGAEPRTQWLPDTVRRDRSGFVMTGTDLLDDGRPATGRCGGCRCSWNRACPASSRSAMSGTGR